MHAFVNGVPHDFGSLVGDSWPWKCLISEYGERGIRVSNNNNGPGYQMNMKKGLWLLVVGQLVACGGGGGGGEASSPTPSSSAPAMYSVSVTVTGLNGTGLVLQNNGANDLTISANGTATFATQIASGRAYSVTVKTLPTAPLGQQSQVCDVSNGGGIVGSAAVTNVTANCRVGIGKFLYVTNYNSNNISAFRINSTTGSLTQVAGSPFATGSFPVPAFSNRVGTNLYVMNVAPGGGAAISVYAIDATTGALTEVSGSPYRAGSTGGQIFFHPSQKFLYASDSSNGRWYGYSMDASTGQLTPVPGSPFAVGTVAQGVTFDAAGKYMYALYGQYTTAGGLYVFSVDTTTGALTFSSSLQLGTGYPLFVQMHPSGNFLYAATVQIPFVGQFALNLNELTVNSVTGGVAAMTGSPLVWPAAPALRSASFHVSGNFMYVGTYGGTSSVPTAGSIDAYSINQNTGQITAIAGASYLTGGNGSSGPIQYPGGNYLTTLNTGSKSVSVFAVNSTSGALTVLGGSPVSISGTSLSALRFDPSGKFAYVLDTGSALIYAYSIDLSSGLIALIGSYPIGTGPNYSVVIAGLQ